MSRGIPKELAVRAKEQLDKQQRLVSRLTANVDRLDRELREQRIDLANETKILQYYASHPLLQEKEENPEPAGQLHDFSDPLPLTWPVKK